MADPYFRYAVNKEVEAIIQNRQARALIRDKSSTEAQQLQDAMEASAVNIANLLVNFTQHHPFKRPW